MSPSLESAHDDQHFARYLLGQLSDEEAEHLDEMSITDDDTAARLRAVEDDLVDAYVRGTLPADTRVRFETVYLASARRRERVEFAQHFRRAVDRTEAPAVEAFAARAAAPAASPAAAAPALAPKARPWLAWAAAILVLVSGGLIVQQMQLRSRLDDARRENAALDAHAQDLARQLSSAQTASSGTATAPAVAGGGTASASASTADIPSAGTLVLLPDTRAANAFPALVLTGAARAASFVLRLEPGDFAAYDVTLHDPATNHDVWKSAEIHVTRGTSEPSVRVTVPASVFKTQHYSFNVTAATAGGGREVVGSYTFEVQR